jgi:hypothetical protein
MWRRPGDNVMIFAPVLLRKLRQWILSNTSADMRRNRVVENDSSRKCQGKNPGPGS